MAKLIKKYIPISVDEMDVMDVMDVYMGEREGKKNNLAACELCEKPAPLKPKPSPKQELIKGIM